MPSNSIQEKPCQQGLTVIQNQVISTAHSANSIV